MPPVRLLDVILVLLLPPALVVVLDVFPELDVELIEERVPRALVVVLNKEPPAFRKVELIVLAGLLPIFDVVVLVAPFRFVMEIRLVVRPALVVDVKVVPPDLIRVVCL